MNPLLLIAETVQSPGIGETFDKFGVNTYDMVSQAVCFLILAYVINRFVFKPVMKLVDQRHKEAEETALNAEKIRIALRETEEARTEIIRKAHDHAEKLTMGIKADVDLMIEQEMIRTEKLAVQILAKAKDEALLNQKKIKLELRDEIAEMIVHLTSVLAKKNLNHQDKERLIDSALKAMSGEITEDEAGVSR